MCMSNPLPSPRTLVPSDAPAIVSGASRGIGRATALRLAAAGRPVGLLARSNDALDTLAQEIRTRGGIAVVATCDMAVPEQIPAAVELCTKTLGPIRVLVNNAGVFLDRPMHETTLDDWQRVLRVNLTGSFVLAQAIWPHMVHGGGGVIVNIASKSAVQGYAGQSAYCASKAGLVGWARAVALEGKAHRIRVHNICPGGVDTDLLAGTSLAERMQGQPMMKPEDVADAVQFCISQPADVDIPEFLMARFGV